MASVFDGKTKVGRSTADPRTDQKLPDSSQLEYFIIDSDAAVGVSVGVRCSLVHGDAWLEIDKHGNRTINIAGNETTTISQNESHLVTGNQTITVGQDHNETIMGNTLQTMIGPHIVSNMDVRNETRAITHLHTHGDNFFQYGPDNQFHYCETNMGAWIFLFEAEAEHSEVAHHHLEGKVVHNYFAVFDTSTCAARMQNVAINEEAAVSAARVNIMRNHVMALETKLGPLEAKVTALEASAGLHRTMGAAP